MKLFDRLKKDKTSSIDFSTINSNEAAIPYIKDGTLAPLYLIALRFNGEASIRNRLYVPPVVVQLKDHYDDMVEDLLVQEKVNGYQCIPTYKGKSIIPSTIKMIATNDGESVFSQTIQVW